MKTALLSTALFAAIAMPSVASAQALPAASVGYVDVQRVTNECTACKTASAAIQAQANALRTRETSLSNPLETEGRAIQTAIDALKGAAPDTALQTRVRNFEAKRQSAAQELARGQQTLQRNVTHVNQQISAKLGPVLQQVRTRRGIGVLLDAGNLLSADTKLDVTADVLTALNAALPSISATAPAQAATPAPRQSR